ncbi:hypothetical protein V5O48_006705 [Marasmius crinis-equi]|uniref:Poly(A) RNA polymerase mitochondrial-like central palm domain-containing protein n=1 Tax=Marasmius crinis-equi TaxID=585013 RepID=A0ABR3FIU4_9AGAR
MLGTIRDHQAARNRVQQRVVSAIRSSLEQNERLARWGALAIRPYGSSILGVSLPTSDIDLALFTEKHANMEREEEVELLKRIHQVLLADEENWLAVDARLNATVPILCGTTTERLGGVKFDFSTNRGDGLQSAEVVARYIGEFPSMSKLLIVMKTFLWQRGLDDPSEGGLGGYALSLMVYCFIKARISFCISYYALTFQQNGYCARSEDVMKEGSNLGTLVVDFFAFYLRPRCDNGICIMRTGKFVTRDTPSTEFRILIEDPAGPATEFKDVAKATTRFPDIRRSFADAVEDLFNYAEVGMEFQSVLSLVFPRNQSEIIEWYLRRTRGSFSGQEQEFLRNSQSLTLVKDYIKRKKGKNFIALDVRSMEEFWETKELREKALQHVEK